MSEHLPACKCPVGGCEVEIPATTETMQLMFLQSHIRDAHGYDIDTEVTGVVEESSGAEVAAEKPSQDAKVARKETTDEAADVSLEHWGRGAELNGDQVAGLGKHVEATDVVEESSGEEVAKGRVSFECGNCHYTTPTLRRSKATQKLRAHSRGCKAREGGQNAYGKEPEAVQEDVHTELPQYDTDNGDNYQARDAKVARKETTDEAADVSSEHWGREAEPNGDQVAGLEAKYSREKVPGKDTTGAEVSGRESPVKVPNGEQETKPSGEKVPGKGDTDEATDEEHRGPGAALPHPSDILMSDPHRGWVTKSSREKVPGKGTTGAKVSGRERPVEVPNG